jgi:hypothetical protein
VAVLFTILWSHGAAAVLRDIFDVAGPLVAVELTWAAVVVAVGGVLCWRSRSSGLAPLVTFMLAGAVSAGISMAIPGAFVSLASLLIVGPLVTWLGRHLAQRFPTKPVELFRSRRWIKVAWGLAAIVTIVQFGRLANHVTDPSQPFVLSTSDPFWAEHECLPAYVHAGELAARGEENVWDVAHYPGINPDAEPDTRLHEMAVEDPYQYTPQFLLPAAAAISITDQYSTIRIVWFAVQVTLFLMLAFLLATWIGGRAGSIAVLALPFAASAFGALYNFQYGQVHLLAIAAALGGMVAFAKSRHIVGGGLLAGAILAKIFPAFLLFGLLGARRWKALGWTLVFGLLATAGTLVFLGTAPIEAFFEYHLPRLQSGAAFAFWEVFPEFHEVLVADNQGAFGIVMKLEAMGVADLPASVVSKVYMGVLAIAAVIGGRAIDDATRAEKAAFWLGLLGLASLGSPAAFGDYVPVAATWLLTLMAYRLVDANSAVKLLVAVAGVALYTVLGTAPIGEYFDAGVMLPLSLVTALTLFVVCAWPVAEQVRRALSSAPHPGLASLKEAI